MSEVAGERRPIRGPLFQERVATLDGLVGHVRQPGCLPGEQLLTDQPIVETDSFTVDLAAKKVIRHGAEVHLTPTEWGMLEMLVRNRGKLVGREELLREVWGPGYADATGNLRLYMAQLRRKLEPDPARPRWLVTEPGMGYRYQPSPDEDA